MCCQLCAHFTVHSGKREASQKIPTERNKTGAITKLRVLVELIGYLKALRMIFNPFSANPTKWSNKLNLSENCRRIVWVCLTILWNWSLKGYWNTNLRSYVDILILCCAYSDSKKKRFIQSNFELNFLAILQYFHEPKMFSRIFRTNISWTLQKQLFADIFQNRCF